MSNQETIDAIKLMVLGSMLADYGARLIKDNTKQTLKYRVNCVIQAVKNLEMHFINHDNTTDQYREAFKRSFLKKTINDARGKSKLFHYGLEYMPVQY